MAVTTEQNGTALAVRESPQSLGLRFAIPLDELRVQIAQLEEFKRDIMIEGVDYGVIPGTPKPTLLKPGAEKLTLVFGLAPTFEVTSRVEDWDRGFFHYETRCDITNRRSGEVIASAHGSANSREPRYRWRDAKPTCPDCGFDLRRSKRNPGDPSEPGWYCWSKIGGCGAQWPADTVTRVGRVENPEPFELVNTLMKMAEKRSLVAATLIATGGSGYFTQDVEDMPSVAGETVIDTPARQTRNGGGYVPTDVREVEDQPRPKNVRQAAAQRQLKPTTTKCSQCERMVETEAVLRDSQKRFNEPLCVAHMNEALDRGKSPSEQAEEVPL
jgi:hypothetical protein